MIERYSINTVRERFNHGVPHAVMLYGPEGTQRTELQEAYESVVKGDVYIVDSVKMSAIRDVIQEGGSLIRPRLYVISDGAKMNNGVQNALLKVLEEPPEFGYYLFFSVDDAGILTTFRARVQEWQIVQDSYKELLKVTSDETLANICKTSDEVLRAINDDYLPAINLAELVVDKIDNASLGSILLVKNKLVKNQYEWFFRGLLASLSKRGDYIGVGIIEHHYYMYLHTDIYAERLIETSIIRLWQVSRYGVDSLKDPVGWWSL